MRRLHGTSAAGGGTFRVGPGELRHVAPRHTDGRFVAQLDSPGLGGTSYVVVPAESAPPAWIVLEYADGHERHWRRSRPGTDGVFSFTLIDDTASGGYVTERSGSLNR